MTNICVDLWDLIIGYVPINDLLVFSKACPAVCQKICMAGYRMFYKKGRAYFIGQDDIIIVTFAGSKFLLRKEDEYNYIDKVNGKACSRLVEISSVKHYKYNNGHNIHVDRISNISMIRSFMQIQFVKGISDRIGCATIKVTNKIIAGIDHIDFTSKMIVEHNRTEKIVAVESFKVIYNGRWLKN